MRLNSKIKKMSWLLEYLNCTFPCNRKCCESNELSINSVHFWKKLKEKTEISKPYKLLHEKKIYLSEYSESILSIGLIPQNEFKVYARLEINITNDVILMNATNLMNFLEILSQYFNENIILPPSSCKASNIQLTPIQQRIFKLNIDGKFVKIDEESLQILFRMKSHIKMYILMLQYQQKPYESLLFKLLNHFCYDKTIKESTDSSKLIYTQQFFEDVIDLHCDCIEKPFILEIATNFAEWFSTCVPIFVKVLMLNESLRLKTFSTNTWPHAHQYINVKKLAKVGLYFTGVGDCVECPFCDLKLHGWNPDDDAVKDHHIYSPNCLFLQNPKLTQNNADLDTDLELAQLLNIFNNSKTTTFDEVDV